MNKNCRTDRIGLKSKNKFGEEMEVVGYRDCHHCDIKFENGFIKQNVDFKEFQNGTSVNPYTKIVFGVACHGEGKYKITNENNKPTEVYNSWKNMLSRCYNEKEKSKRKTYEGCYVCEEWLVFQNYAEWYFHNYYTVDGQGTQLDKDILLKHNKCYSPETCVFTPKQINAMFIKNERIRGQYCIGVMKKKCKGYEYLVSQCSIKNKLVSERCDNEMEGFLKYKNNKENEIKRLANKYKQDIPEKLYIAMMNYEVEVDD